MPLSSEVDPSVGISELKGPPNHCAESYHLQMRTLRSGGSGKEGVEQSKGSRTVGSDELICRKQVDLRQITYILLASMLTTFFFKMGEKIMPSVRGACDY